MSAFIHGSVGETQSGKKVIRNDKFKTPFYLSND
jgi:hypothetical protein